MEKLLGKTKDFVRLMRPKQWFKSFYIVFGAMPAIFLMPVKLDLILLLLTAGIANMILIQGVIYSLNDIADCESDKKHPVKRFRPIASGRISKKQAFIFALILFSLACFMAIFIDIRILAIDIVLVLINIFYSYWPRLKDFIYLDIGTAALNFPLRVAVGWYLFEPYNYARFSLNLQIISRIINSNSIQALFFSAPPRIIELSVKFSSITLSFISITIFTYFLACYLLALKRLREKIEGHEKSRKVLKKYSQAKLKAISIVSGFFVFIFYTLLSWSLKLSLAFLSPILAYALMRYYRLTFEKKSIVGKPEEIFRNREFQILFIITGILGLILLFI